MAYTTRPSLLKRVSDGEDAAWNDFYIRYAPFIRSIGRNSQVFLSESEIEELLQETMISLFRNNTVAKYDPAKGRFHSYLYNIVERNAIDIIRKRKNCEPAEEEVFEDSFRKIFDLEYQHYIIGVLLDELKGIVSATNFQVFQYLQLQGHSPKDTAAAFEIPVGRIYTIRKRCIQHLKKIAAECNLEESGFPW